MQGEQLGPYRIDREIGAGGMGTVYAATAQRPSAGLALGTCVALKVVHPHLLENAEAVARFRREVEIGSSVRHPNVIRTIEGGRHEGRHYLVMELLEGQTLAELRAELDHVPEELCRHIGCEVARGLSAIHAVGAVHRDVKPDNVLITPDHVVKIMDLGVARIVGEAMRLSQTGAFVGSLQYAAPECFSRELGVEDHRVDLHALGLVLYELSSGDAPYAAPDVHATIRRVLDERPRRLGELNPQVSPFFEDVVHTLLVKEPRGRFANADDLLQALEQGEDGGWWHARAKALRIETRRPLRRIRIPRETAIYGREEEIAQLSESFTTAAGGEGQVVLIEGEAGIGKSRLVDELLLRLQRSGEDVNFVFGGYPPGGAATASGAFSTAYREQFGDAGSAPYLTDTPLLVPAFDALLRGDATPAGAQSLSKGSLQTCFVHATRALAAERPTVVLIDDLHFAPEEGRALFTALSLAVPGHRVLLIGTARRGMSKEWLSGVTRLTHCRQLQLDRLGPKDLYSLLHDALRSDRLADRLAGKIGLQSDGNPFFVFEILRGLREGLLITRSPDGTWVSTAEIDQIEIPSSVLDLIEARVADLSEEEHELLEVAACCGFEFDGTLVAEALGQARIPTLRRLGRLEKRHRLVRASGRRHVFDHHQVRDVLYEGMSEVLREEYHAALAGVLEAREGGPGRDLEEIDGAACVDLCHHFFLGGQPARADRYLSAATAHLVGGYLYDRAISLAQRALGVPGLVTGLRRAELLRTMAYWLSNVGNPPAERAALDEALTLAEEDGDPVARVRAHKSLGNHLAHAADRDGAMRHLRTALDLARESGDRKLEGVVTNALATGLYFQSEFDEARELLRAHIAIALETDDLRQEARARSNLGLVFLGEARYDEATELFEQTLELARKVGDRYGQSVAISNLGGIAYSRGRWSEARAAFEQDLVTSRELGDRRAETVVTGNLGVAVRAAGHLIDASRCHARYLDLAEELGDARAAASARGMLGTLHLVLGDHEASERWIGLSIASAEEIGDRRTQAWAHRRAGELHATLGRFDDAVTAYGRAMEISRDLGVRGLLVEALSECGAAHLLAGRREAALGVLDEGLALAHDIGSPEWIVLGTARMARLRDSEVDTAVHALAEHQDRLGAVSRLRARYLVWRLTRDDEHLATARSELDSLLAQAPEAARDPMLTNVPVNRAIVAADPDAIVE